MLIHRTAAHIRRAFDGKAYRTGGDEFVVIDASSGEEAFFQGVEAVREAMRKDGLHISAGASWRGEGCNIKEQFDEADRRMYEDKKRFYSDGQARPARAAETTAQTPAAPRERGRFSRPAQMGTARAAPA